MNSWGGSINILSEISFVDAISIANNENALTIACIIVLLVFLLLRNHIFSILPKILNSFFFIEDTDITEESSNFKVIVNILLSLSFPILVLLITIYGRLNINDHLSLLYLFLGILFYYGTRIGLLRLFAYMNEDNHTFNRVYYLLNFYIIFTTVLCLIPTPVILISSEIYPWILIFIGISLLFLSFIHIIHVFRIIIASHVSLFFSFLYICTLEILPLGIIAIYLYRLQN